MATTDIESKIAKLLAMAEGTTNAHEAEAFMAQAERLMLKYGVEQATLQAQQAPGTKQEDIEIKQVLIPDGHGYALAMIQIAHAIGPSFSLRTLQSNVKGSGSKVAWFIGHTSDVEQAVTLFNSMVIQSKAQAVAWWRNEGRHNTIWLTENDAYLARREFIFSFARGAGSRLAETLGKVVEQHGNGAELVLVDRADRVERWVDHNLKVGKGRATQRRTGAAEARQAGWKAGRDAINGKALQG